MLLLALVLVCLGLTTWLLLPPTGDDDSRLESDPELLGVADGATPEVRTAQREGQPSPDPTQAVGLRTRAGGPRVAVPLRGPVDVRVVSLHGQPLPHTRIRINNGWGMRSIRRTSADGTLYLKDEPYDGSAWLRALDVGTETPTKALVRGPRVTLRVPSRWPLRLQPVDAETGKHVAGVAWRLHLDADPEHPLVDAETGAASIHARPGGPCIVALEVVPPAGYVAWDIPIFENYILREATSLLLVYPLRREVHLTAAYDRTDHPELDDASLARVRIGELKSPLRPLKIAKGMLRVGGIPFFGDTPWVVRLTKPARTLPGGPRAHVIGEASGQIPRKYTKEIAGKAHRIFHRGGVNPDGTAQQRMASFVPVWRIRQRRDERRFVSTRSAGRLPDRPGWARGTLRILRSDGRHAPGAKFRMWGVYRRADERGTYSFLVPAGNVRFRLIEPGLVRTMLRVHLKPRHDNEVVLRERRGGRLEVAVVDEAGAPLPYARVRVRMPARDCGPITWDPRVRRLQRVDDFTDHTGRRTYDVVDPGRVFVEGEWADRAGKAVEEVASGETKKVQLVLRATNRRQVRAGDK